MTHDELLARIDEDEKFLEQYFGAKFKGQSALRAVVELHKPWDDTWPSSGNPLFRCSAPDCTDGFTHWPCLTIQAIEKELG